MAKIKPFRILEEEILLLQEEAKKRQLTIKEILHILSGKGRPILLLLLALPFCQPIQIPGMSTPFGLAVAFIGLRMSFGKHVWLPKSLLSYRISSEILGKITDTALKLIRKIKTWIYPRMPWLCHSPLMEILNGIVICLLGIFLALPLPIPLSNLAAAWSIFFFALGILEDDGLLVLIGYVTTFLTIIIMILMVLSVEYFLLKS